MKSTRKFLIPTLILAILGGGAWYAGHRQNSSVTPTTPTVSTTAAVFHPDPHTKTSNCIIHGALPDHACTPGVVFANVTKDQICTSGYASSVRDVPVALKKKVYAEYSITHHIAGEYEVDHYISLELGGSNDIANLWSEAATPTPGFHEKDKVENYLHDQVCTNKISLNEAQRMIAGDWLKVWEGIK